MTVDTLIDFDLAAATARELLPAGPAMGRREREAVVADLRDAAHTSTDLVLDVMNLPAAAADEARAGLGRGRILVVDRVTWAQANAESMRAMLAGPLEAALAKRDSPLEIGEVARAGTGAELGAVLAFLGTRVLGQYDPFGDPNGRLLLVAPTIVSVQQRLEVPPADFRLWVALHEETHRVQFATAPWLRDVMTGAIGELAGGMLDTSGFGERFTGMLRQIPEVFGQGGSKAVMDVIQTPAERAVVDRLSGMMSLLEGHADVVMDEVGPSVIPSVRQIRRKFTARRQDNSGLQGLLKKLLGLEAKTRQYEDGAAFVRGVVLRVGHSGLNRVWESPEHLPSMEEIAEPQRWIDRVHSAR